MATEHPTRHTSACLTRLPPAVDAQMKKALQIGGPSHRVSCRFYWSGREDLNLPCGPCLSSPQLWRQSSTLFVADLQRLRPRPAHRRLPKSPTRHELAVLLRRRGSIGPSCDLPSVGRVAPTPYAEYAQRLCQNLVASGPLCETVRCRTRFKFGPPAPARCDRCPRTDRYLCPAIDLTPQ